MCCQSGRSYGAFRYSYSRFLQTVRPYGAGKLKLWRFRQNLPKTLFGICVTRGSCLHEPPGRCSGFANASSAKPFNPLFGICNPEPNCPGFAIRSDFHQKRAVLLNRFSGSRRSLRGSRLRGGRTCRPASRPPRGGRSCARGTSGAGCPAYHRRAFR